MAQRLRSPADRPTDTLEVFAGSAQTRQRYDRIAPIYDWIEAVPERLAVRAWRQMFWERVDGPRILEIGVGTGKNVAYYQPETSLTAIDFSPGMLQRAMRLAQDLDAEVAFQVADAQHLPVPDQCFNSVVRTCVFSSVPDPIQGLRKAARVLTPGGQLPLLEHVPSKKRLLRRAMQLVNPLMVRLAGAISDRDSVANVRSASFRLVSVEGLWLDVVKLIEARLDFQRTGLPMAGLGCDSDMVPASRSAGVPLDPVPTCSARTDIAWNSFR